MRVRVRIYGGETIILEFEKDKALVKEVIEKLGLLPTATIVTRKGRVLLEEELVYNDDELTVYRLQDFIS